VRHGPIPSERTRISKPPSGVYPRFHALLVLRLMGSDSSVVNTRRASAVEKRHSILSWCDSGADAPEFSEGCNPLSAQALPRPQALASSWAGLSAEART
jgi:hypothetical protein